MTDIRKTFTKGDLQKKLDVTLPLPQPVPGGSNSAKPYIVWDQGHTFRGSKLGVRISPGGQRTFVVRYALYRGKKLNGKGEMVSDKIVRRDKVMDVDDFVRSTLTLDQLRQKAHELATDAKQAGKSPVQVERESREQEAAQRGAQEAQEAARAVEDMTIAAAGQRYIEHCDAIGKFRPTSGTPRAVKLAVERAVKFFAHKPLRKLDGHDGASFLNWVVDDVVAATKARAAGNTGTSRIGGRAKGKHPGHQQAGSTKSHIKQVLLHARTELGVDCRTDILDAWKPKKNPPLKGAMTPEQRAALFRAIDEWTTAHSNLTGARLATAKDTGDIIRFAFLTGSRQGEVCRLMWRQIENLDGPLDSAMPPTLIFEEGDRKQNSDHRLALDAESVAVLKRVRSRRRRRGWTPQPGHYIFPSRDAKSPDEKHRTSVQAAFNTILANAGLRGDDVPYLERLNPHRVVKASRITQMRDEFGWSAAEVADELGMTIKVVEDVYYVDRTKVARSAARKAGMAPSLAPGVT